MVSYGKNEIIRMVCYFKIDTKKSLNFLWSSSIRIAEDLKNDQWKAEKQIMTNLKSNGKDLELNLRHEIFRKQSTINPLRLNDSASIPEHFSSKMSYLRDRPETQEKVFKCPHCSQMKTK